MTWKYHHSVGLSCLVLPGTLNDYYPIFSPRTSDSLEIPHIRSVNPLLEASVFYGYGWSLLCFFVGLIFNLVVKGL